MAQNSFLGRFIKMPKSFNWFLKKELLLKDITIRNLAMNYMKKARNNIITMELLNKAPNFRGVLELPSDYNTDEWVVVAAYYSMYMAALGILSKLDYKSRNHSATIVALEEFFVKKKMLDKEYLNILEKMKVKKEEIEELNKARDRRETAQYSVTKETTKSIAEETRRDAHKFVDKIEELFDLID